MNSESCCTKTRACVYVLGIAGTFLLVAGLVWLLRSYTQTPPLGQARIQERVKNLNDHRAANAALLEKYDWQDKTKDVVRVPIERAKELTLQEWQNPAAARSNLLARAAKAFYVPPKAPEKPSQYE
jgi:hypothetical protein